MEKVDKRMVLEYTHGLFITKTEFRLSTTFNWLLLYIRNYGIGIHSLLYTQKAFILMVQSH
jgi:hypothetical protein